MGLREIETTPRNLRAVRGKATTPRVFVEGKLVGGADDLEKFLAAK